MPVKRRIKQERKSKREKELERWAESVRGTFKSGVYGPKRSTRSGLFGPRGRLPNPALTKAQKREKARKASVERRVAAALAKFLKQANPAMKGVTGASMQRLKGGVLKITPIKAKRGRK